MNNSFKVTKLNVKEKTEIQLPNNTELLELDLTKIREFM